MNAAWSGLRTEWIDRKITYTGIELRPHYILSELGIEGAAVVAFRGPCAVPTEHLVDWQDRREGESIIAQEMVHFLGEFFGPNLRETVLLQRLWVARIAEALGPRVYCRGNDLMVRTEGGADRKLSVSIVTASPVSTLFHLGLNIDPKGAPVPAVGLVELGVEPVAFARQTLEQMGREWFEISWACAKVRPVV